MLINVEIYYLLGIAIGCGEPTLASGVTVEPYNTTTVGSVIFYQCQQSGLSPSRTGSVCEGNEIWSPDPSQVVCTDENIYQPSTGLIIGKVGECHCFAARFTFLFCYIFHASWGIWIPSAIIFHSSSLLFPL